MTQPKSKQIVLEDEISDKGGLRWAQTYFDKAYFQFEHPAEAENEYKQHLQKNEIVIALGPCVTVSGGRYLTRCLSQHGVIWVTPRGLRTRENAPH
jgi:hypothetical protein